MSCDLTTWTLEEIQDAVIENASFEEDGSVAKAKLFSAAARRWLIIVPQSTAHLGNSMTLNVQYVNQMLNRALDYIQSQTDGDSVRFMTSRGWSR